MLKELNPCVRFIDKTENIRFGHETVTHESRFIYVWEGSCDISFDGKRHHIKSGDALYLPPCQTYTLRGASSASLEVIRFDLTSQCEENASDEAVKKALFAPFDSVIYVQALDCRALLEALEKALVSPSKFSCDRASCLMKEILLVLAEESEKEHGLTPLTRKIVDYVNEHFAEAEITNQEIAAHFGYHPYHISRVMREESGKTLKAYIIWYRLHLASKMLSLTDASIADVARASGFESQSYFSKMFREEFGTTPGEYRKAHTRQE